MAVSRYSIGIFVTLSVAVPLRVSCEKLLKKYVVSNNGRNIFFNGVVDQFCLVFYIGDPLINLNIISKSKWVCWKNNRKT
jgi:hypothetical protein